MVSRVFQSNGFVSFSDYLAFINAVLTHGDAGGTDDREIVSYDGRVMLLRFVDPEVAARFGAGIYVRCARQA
jgi:Na+/citrate or Na+/malate symporter